MAKRRVSRLDALRVNRVLYDVFHDHDGFIEGNAAHVADALRLHGVSINRLMGKDPATIIREAENEWLRHWLRDLDYPIDGTRQRIYQFDGTGWIHLPLVLYLNTTHPDVPDAKLRRDELIERLNSIIRLIIPRMKGDAAKKRGLEVTIKKVRQGAQYEQPQLPECEDESSGGAA